MQSAVKMRSEKTATPEDGEDGEDAWCYDTAHGFTFVTLVTGCCSLALIPVPIRLDQSIELMMLDAPLRYLNEPNSLASCVILQGR